MGLIFSVAMSASEAVERNVRNAHDKHLLLNELKQLESNLQLSQKEIQRQKDDLKAERQKHKTTYLEKLAAERKVSELLVAKSRLEVGDIPKWCAFSLLTYLEINI
jgi:septal ring factor EnvC (AmiA/AmiB activator)